MGDKKLSVVMNIQTRAVDCLSILGRRGGRVLGGRGTRPRGAGGAPVSTATSAATLLVTAASGIRRDDICLSAELKTKRGGGLLLRTNFKSVPAQSRLARITSLVIVRVF